MSKLHEVIVGNIGTVYSGNSLFEAMRAYKHYRELSEFGTGRAGGESVVRLSDGQVECETFRENEAPR